VVNDPGFSIKEIVSGLKTGSDGSIWCQDLNENEIFLTKKRCPVIPPATRISSDEFL
jgi:hypothetical protein